MFLRKTKATTLVNTWMIKQNSLVAHIEKVSVYLDRRSNQLQHSLKQNWIQSNALTLFNSMKAERDEEATREKFEASWH